MWSFSGLDHISNRSNYGYRFQRTSSKADEARSQDEFGVHIGESDGSKVSQFEVVKTRCNWVFGRPQFAGRACGPKQGKDSQLKGAYVGKNMTVQARPRVISC